MSFMLTTKQVRASTKTVTRRLGWTFLKPGDIVQAVEKCRGLKKGERVKRLAVIQIESVTREVLHALVANKEYGASEVVREGFPEMTPAQFVDFFMRTHHCVLHAKVTRIAFRYIAPVIPV